MLKTPFGKKQQFASATSSSAPANMPIFNIFGGDSGCTNLLSTITFGSTDYTASFRFAGENATTSAWTASVGTTNLAITGTGSDVSVSQDTPFTTSAEYGVKINAAKYFSTGSTSAYDIVSSTTDCVFEVVFKYGANGAGEDTIFSKYSLSGTGYLLLINGSAQIVGYGASALSASSSFVEGAWYHVMVFSDRNGNNRLYINGVYTSQIANPNKAESNTQPLQLSAYDAGYSKGNHTIALAQAWLALGAGVITSTSECDTIAAQRFAKLCGCYPITAIGSATPTFTRSSIAYLDRYTDKNNNIRKIFKVGPNWPRICERKSGSTFYKGFLSENTTTNRLLQSENLAHASWSQLNCTVAASGTAVDGTSSYGLTPSIGLSQHTLNQTVTASSDFVSIFAKQGANQYAAIRVNSGGGGTDYAIFDLANGTVTSTSGTNVNAQVEAYGSGWYRIACGPIGGTDSIYFISTNSSTSLAYLEASGASIGTYFSHAMVSTSTTRLIDQSPVFTTTAAASRSADLLSFVGTSNFNSTMGAIDSQVIAKQSTSVVTARTIVQPYHDANNYHLYQINSSAVGAYNVLTSSVAQVVATGTATIADATVHTATQSYIDNNWKAAIDYVSDATDANCTMPTISTAIYIGNNQGGTTALHGIISSLKIYKKLKL